MNKIIDSMVQATHFNSCGVDFFIGKFVDITRPELINIGNHVAIDSFFYCTTAMQIGDYVHIPPHVSVIGGAKGLLTMEDFSGMAAGTRIVCGSEDYTAGGLIGATIPLEYRAPLKLAPVTFKRFAIAGTNCTILPGVTLGKGSVIGAGSVVTKSTDSWGIYVGTPAKLLRYRSDEDIAKTLEYAKKLGYV